MYHSVIDLTAFSYILTLYVLLCSVVVTVVRLSVPRGLMRTTFIVFGCLSPVFAFYIAYRVVAGKTAISAEEKELFVKVEEDIERKRIERFGGRNIVDRIRTEYIRTLDRTAQRIERLVVKAA
jgi:hypothetical protein